MPDAGGFRLSVDRLMAGRRSIIEDFACSLPGAGIVCLVGPNGAGKSLLIRALAGVERRQHVSLLDPRGVACELAVAFDFAGVVPSAGIDSLLDSAQWFGTARDDVNTMFSRLGVDPANELPFSRWSLGARQRARLATVLASRRPVLLLDEPFRSIDDEHRLALIDLLVDVSKDRLIIVSTHHPELLNGFTAATIVLRTGESGPTTATLHPAPTTPRHRVQVTGRGVTGIVGAERIENAEGVTLQSSVVDRAGLDGLLTELAGPGVQVHSLVIAEELSSDSEPGMSQ